jgi:hypothetical protein
MANWRLVLNAVCLPVLTYGSQLWFLTGAAKGLINMVQRVQNDMVRQVTGVFRTAPREPLLHFTRMLPMKFFIKKLTYTSALRLYRLPRESQILRRLGVDWYSPGQGDLPLPVPRSRILPGKRNQRPTALEALALKVPSGGPKVDMVALAPWEVPNWVEHVSYMGVENPCVRKAWIRDLTGAVKDLSTMLVHLAAATLNREADGLSVVGGAAATYSRGGAEITSHDWVIGTDLTQFDADAYVLARAVEVMAQCYTAEVAPPDHTYFFCASSPALQAVQNPRSIKAHSFALRFHHALTTLFSLHNRRITLCWAPKDDSLEGNLMARSLASQACSRERADLPNSMDRILLATFQKDHARRAAFRQWELEYKAARTRNTLHIESYGSPLDGAAYQYAISQPPSEVNHPLWSATVTMEKDKQGRKTRRPIFTWRTTSTAFQLAVDHAFTGSYAKRFRPNDPPSSLRCPCKFHLRNPDHLIRHCRYHYPHCLSNQIISRGLILSLKTLFSHSVEHSHRLLSFIQQSRAAMHPPEMEASNRMPLEPD